jgi:hypothetical protein
MSKGKRPHGSSKIDREFQRYAEGMLDLLGAWPEAARMIKRVANKRNVSFELVVHEALALTYQGVRNEPLPPKLRAYLTRNEAQTLPSVRAILNADLN